jgi:protein gp37
MGDTKIEWAEKVWNPVTGCTKVSEGCKNCYAERVANRFWAEHYAHDTLEGPIRKFTDVRCHPERLQEPLYWRKPRRIFVASMGDLFHESIPDSFIGAVFGIMAAQRASHHTFLVLTKRPKRMLAWLDGLRQMKNEVAWCQVFACVRLCTDNAIKPEDAIMRLAVREKETWPLPNVHLGVSISNQPDADRDIPLLLQTPAAVRFVSYEPALNAVDFSEWLAVHSLPPPLPSWTENTGEISKLDWIICGAESGPHLRLCKLHWIRLAVMQCQSAGVPVFVKQLHINGKLSRNPDEWPEDLRVREFPEGMK